MQASIYSNSVIDIIFDEPTNAIIMNWRTTPTSKEFKAGLTRGLDLAKHNGISKWVGNVSKLGVIDPDDQEWSNQVWFPMAIGAGIHKMAVIVSDDVFNQLSVEQIMNRVESINFESKYFDNINEALTWLN